MTRRTEPNYCYISLEETDDWRIPEALKPYIHHITRVWAFNRNAQTNCCEVTPSYYLEPITEDWTSTEAFQWLSAEDQDLIAVRIGDFLHENGYTEPLYMHVSYVERLIKDGRHHGFHEAGALRSLIDEDDGLDPNRVVGALHDYWHSHPRF